VKLAVDPTLVADLERIVEPATMGDPERVLKWVSKSPAKLADALRAQGHEVIPIRFSKLLNERLGYSRQVNRKTHEAQATPIATPSSSTSTSGWSLQSPPADRCRKSRHGRPGLTTLRRYGKT
jgi:Rhodopirellula transposase DDE domain